jgi:hypothetical protein
MSPDRRICLDYKSTSSAAPDFFSKQIGRMGYDLQSEFYTRGISAVTGGETTFVMLAQEITPPYACSLMSLSNTFREVGKLKVTRAIDLWTKCVTKNEWPGYTSKILYAEPTPWQLTDAETTSDTTEDEV